MAQGEHIHKKVITLAKKRFKIPGVTFSWKRVLGITKVRRKIAHATGIPTTKAGRKRKAERLLWKIIFGK